ncbi:hypothetical protein EUGRSUZ_C03954 [Eucalyptus grandis]|uniref:Uncharacterized protein n=3 Tax=Eucalyptus grandis TaxID=71139 RepID=A0A059CWG7_EUCGR|nr:hypothetical protein EUGRSUZ_C03954 [Eucalyptus grandis]KAK3439264.1 hypothetical protein EUGRSUZ_C03954 [Eucalyptus grandis]
MFSNLDNMYNLVFFDCCFKEIEFDNVFGQLKNLKLEVNDCETLVRISNLSSLKEYQHLIVKKCPQLIEIELEPSSTGDCSSTERPLPGALKLEKLCLLGLLDCASLRKAPNTSRTTAWNCPRLDGYAEASAHQGALLKEENLGPRDLNPSSCSPLELVHMKSQEQQKEREGTSRQSKEEQKKGCGIR